MDLESNAREETPEESPAHLTAETERKAWCTLGAFYCLFGTVGFLNCASCFQFIYRHKILPNYTPFQLSWISSVQRASIWAFGPLYGRLIDTYGTKVLSWPLAAICVSQVFAMSFSWEYWQFMVSQGLLFGLAAGGLYTASLVSIGQWFNRNRGLVAGIAACGGSLGGIIYPAFLDLAMEHTNFYVGMRYTAGLTGISLLLSLFLARERLPTRDWDSNAKWFDLTLFRQRHYLYFVIGTFLVMWGYWAPVDFVMQSALDAGASPIFALYLIPTMSTAAIPGCIILGHLGDKSAHFLVLVLCSWVLGASLLFLWLPFTLVQSFRGIFAFSLMYGFWGGAFLSLLMPCVVKIGKRESLGQRFGTFQLAIAISCLTGLPIMEAIRTLNHGYVGMQLFASGSVILGTFLLARSLGIMMTSLGTLV